MLFMFPVGYTYVYRSYISPFKFYLSKNVSLWISRQWVSCWISELFSQPFFRSIYLVFISHFCYFKFTYKRLMFFCFVFFFFFFKKFPFSHILLGHSSTSKASWLEASSSPTIFFRLQWISWSLWQCWADIFKWTKCFTAQGSHQDIWWFAWAIWGSHAPFWWIWVTFNRWGYRVSYLII